MLIRYIIFWKLFRICCFDFMSLPCHRGIGLLTRSNRKARCCLVGSDDACEDPLRSARRWVKLVSFVFRTIRDEMGICEEERLPHFQTEISDQ